MKQDSSPLLSCCVIIICCHWILNGEIICDIPGNLRGNRVYGFGKRSACCRITRTRGCSFWPAVWEIRHGGPSALFLFTPVTSFSRNDYGGSVAFDITDSFGTELGIRGYREYPFERGGVTPILMPYYKFKKHKVEMDFGGFLQEIIYGLFK